MTVSVKETNRTWSVNGTISGGDYEVHVVADRVDNSIDCGTTGDYVPAEFAKAQAETILKAVAWLNDADD